MDRKNKEGMGMLPIPGLMAACQGSTPLKGEKKKTEFAETLSQKGAMELAKRLEHYWHLQGYSAARFWAEPIGERFEKVGTYEIYRVVSNLVNGKPPVYQ